MNKIHVEVVVAGSLETVWKFWNDPEHIKKWAFASDDWECPHARNNLVVGGMFTTRMSAKDKSFGFDFSGTYTDIKEYEKISYVMANDVTEAGARACDVTFTDMGDGTVKITEVFDPEQENSEEMQRSG
jgi:uncharacterized protein YndB with AHSA1/START domain